MLYGTTASRGECYGVIGIVAYLYALVIAVFALIITLIIAAYLNRPGSLVKG